MLTWQVVLDIVKIESSNNQNEASNNTTHIKAVKKSRPKKFVVEDEPKDNEALATGLVLVLAITILIVALV